MAKVMFGLLLLMLAVSAPQAREWDDQVVKAAQKTFPEFLDLLAIADVADNPADIQRNAAFLQQAFIRRGFKRRNC